MMKISKFIPQRCPLCFSLYRGAEPICENCRNEIKKYSYGTRCSKCGRLLDSDEVRYCIHCKRVQPQFVLAFAVFPYKGIFKEAIRKVKFYDEYFRIRRMSRLISNEFFKMNLNADCIVYVPTDIKTNFKRRYCLSQEIAYSVASKLNISVYKDFLLKKPNAQKQSLVDFNKRYTNVKNMFMKNPFTVRNVKGKTVFLVDDILTTGSTLSECARILKEAGAKEVYAAALTYGASNA